MMCCQISITLDLCPTNLVWKELERIKLSVSRPEKVSDAPKLPSSAKKARRGGREAAESCAPKAHAPPRDHDDLDGGGSSRVCA